MLCHRNSRGVVAYALQMLTNATPETSPSFADVEMGASAAGDTVHKIFRSAGEMTNIRSPKSSFTIRDHFTCTSENLVTLAGQDVPLIGALTGCTTPGQSGPAWASHSALIAVKDPPPVSYSPRESLS